MRAIYLSSLVILFLSLFFTPPRCGAQSFHTAKAKSPDAGTIFIYPERIKLKRGGKMFTAERGLMFVPLNRSKSDSDVIAIEFYRFPRSAKAKPETPPIFLLNGGPGFPGLEKDLAKLGFFESQIQPYLNISDVVVVGQRGIGSSKPNTVIVQTTIPQRADQLHDDDKKVAQFRKELAKEREFWIEKGVDLSGLNVLEAAADVRDLCQALDYKKITITGGSFGSHWGIAIMRQYPELVARAVLHGMEGPNHTWDHPGWYWNVYKRVAADAESSDALKDLIPEGGLIAAMELMAKNAAEEPMQIVLDKDEQSKGKKVLLDSHAMHQLSRGYSGGLPGWPADVIAMSRGEFEKAARTVYSRTRVRGRSLTTASFWMLDSGSGITAKRRAEYESDPAVQIIGSTFWAYAAGSSVWQTDLGDEFRGDFETDIPTVIVHGTWDRKTPFENALELQPCFKECKFVTVERGTHGALFEAARIKRNFMPAIMKFLETGDASKLPDKVVLPQPKWVVPNLK